MYECGTAKYLQKISYQKAMIGFNLHFYSRTPFAVHRTFLSLFCYTIFRASSTIYLSQFQSVSFGIRTFNLSLQRQFDYGSRVLRTALLRHVRLSASFALKTKCTAGRRAPRDLGFPNTGISPYVHPRVSPAL